SWGLFSSRSGLCNGGLCNWGLCNWGLCNGGLDNGVLDGEELALPLGERLVGGDTGVNLGAGAAAAAGDQTLGDGVGDDAGQQGDGANGVVVARDLVVDLVGVAVRVENRDDRQAELAS